MASILWRNQQSSNAPSISTVAKRTSVSKTHFGTRLATLPARAISRGNNSLEEVDKQRQGNLSSALRMFALEYYRSHSKPPRK